MNDYDEKYVYCPEVDFGGYSEPVILRESCLLKQQNPELPMCYKGCKGKRPKVVNLREIHPKAFEIASLYEEGYSFRDLREKFNVNFPTIDKILFNAGVRVRTRKEASAVKRDYQVDKGSTRQRVFELLDKYSDLTPRRIAELLNCNVKSATIYKSQYKKQKR